MRTPMVRPIMGSSMRVPMSRADRIMEMFSRVGAAAGRANSLNAFKIPMHSAASPIKIK